MLLVLQSCMHCVPWQWCLVEALYMFPSYLLLHILHDARFCICNGMMNESCIFNMQLLHALNAKLKSGLQVYLSFEIWWLDNFCSEKEYNVGMHINSLPLVLGQVWIALWSSLWPWLVFPFNNNIIFQKKNSNLDVTILYIFLFIFIFLSIWYSQSHYHSSSYYLWTVLLLCSFY